MQWMMRGLLMALGVMVALAMAAMAGVLLLLWGVRALWARLSGQPLQPRTPVGGVWQQVWRQRRGGRGFPAAQAGGHSRADADVTDVEPKAMRPK